MSKANFLLATILLINWAKLSSLRPVNRMASASFCLMLRSARSTFAWSVPSSQSHGQAHDLLIPPAFPCPRLFFLYSLPSCLKDVRIMPPPSVDKAFLCLKKTGRLNRPEFRIRKRAHEDCACFSAWKCDRSRLHGTHECYRSRRHGVPSPGKRLSIRA